MKRLAIIILAYLILLLSAVLPVQQTGAPGPPPRPLVVVPPPPEEVRALWVVRTTMTSPEAIRELVRRAKATGFTALIVQVRGRGDAYYVSRWEPRATELEKQKPDFDPLAFTVKEAHAAGLKVHAWINTFLVANVDELPKSADHAIFKHPEWLMVPRAIAADLYRLSPQSPSYVDRLLQHARGNRNELEGLFLSPAHPAVKEQIYDVWIDVVERYDVDGLHFDYVRYPNPSFDYSRPALERFRAEVEKTMSENERKLLAMVAAGDPLVHATTFADRFAQFQRDQVTDMVERIYHGVKARKPKALVSAAVFANDEDAYRVRFQDWKLWLRRGLLDVVCPMAYTPDTETFRQQIAVAVGNAAGRQVWAGVGAYRQAVEGTLEKISTARELGAQGFILFSYDFAVRPSEHNPQGNYLERVREGLGSNSSTGMKTERQ
jgi:uncharacterized lipoprotein YddW (UPF0748 family)